MTRVSARQAILAILDKLEMEDRSIVLGHVVAELIDGSMEDPTLPIGGDAGIAGVFLLEMQRHAWTIARNALALSADEIAERCADKSDGAS